MINPNSLQDLQGLQGLVPTYHSLCHVPVGPQTVPKSAEALPPQGLCKCCPHSRSSPFWSGSRQHTEMFSVTLLSTPHPILQRITQTCQNSSQILVSLYSLSYRFIISLFPTTQASTRSSCMCSTNKYL